MSTTGIPPAAPVAEDRTVAILSYITAVGFIIALVMHGSKKTALGSFHLRQALGLFITAVAFWVPGLIVTFIPFVNFIMILVWPLFGLSLLVMLIMGFVAAANGQMKPVPVMGGHYQKWFGGAFA
jgi:uncharacterized membrane protein